MGKQQEQKANIAILGASGYTGVELIRWLSHHPKVHLHTLVAESNAGKEVAEIYPHLAGNGLPRLVSLEQIEWDNIQVAFCCLPHGTSHHTVAAIPPHVQIIDLSADFRFDDIQAYEEWYHTHPYPDLQKISAYGLTELFREKIRNVRLVACPGCYPTSVLLPLIPLLNQKVIETSPIIVDAKSGVTGAGRSPKQNTHFSEVHGGIKPYNISVHRHTGEIELYASQAAGLPVHIQFTPQLMPMNRGILSTIYVRMKPECNVNIIQEVWKSYYTNEPFVQVVAEVPSTRDVYGTNQARMSVVAGRDPNYAVIVSVIDNLTKGASGQAIQNMNLVMGWPETLGLEAVPVFP